ncbi:MAG: PQQ-binding-like beta-propeller repeat protein [Gammaproteobacteria bacterium]|jgi:polyvinyl alcohol dehydrogenase (cytochrome)|nr:PQQ-binding-like beta-propeller repeat protein [Gammaproteobacteria bacterium]MDH5170953.1 PQQ-binding-like beta-propeller repeat protein [Gammaproteobacteria bacterium]
MPSFILKVCALAYVAALATVPAYAAPTHEQDGAALFEANCLKCHGGKVAKAPPMSLLQIMSASSVLRAMEHGIMQEQAAALNGDQRRLVAEYLTGQKLGAGSAAPPAPACSPELAAFDFNKPPSTRGWGFSQDNKRYLSPETAGLTKADLPGLELKWAFAFPDAIRARSQPAFGGGALYVGSQNGTVYALEAKTGCIRWQFSTIAEVRTAIVLAPWKAGQRGSPMLYFGDLVGNVYALDAVTGRLNWRHRPDEHPSLTLTAAPVLYENRLYVPMSALEVTAAADPTYACCTFRGGVAVYDASSGEKLQVAYTIDQPSRVVGKNAVGTDRIAPSGAPIWNTPAIDPRREVMYVGTGENYSSPANDTSDAILALSLKDGSIVWKQQMTAGDAWNMGCETEEKINCPPENGPDYDFGAATILATASDGRDIVLAGQKSGEVFGLDPAAGGRILWRSKLGRGGIQGGVHFGMAVDGDILYVPMSDFDGGPRWPGVAMPGMYALDIRTGKTLWYTPADPAVCGQREYCQPGISAAATAIDGAVIAGAMDGHLRAYNAADGAVIWDVDTAIDYTSLGGGSARGGSLGGGAGPVMHDGMLYINSGYGIYFHMPGNVLLAFGPAAGK